MVWTKREAVQKNIAFLEVVLWIAAAIVGCALWGFGGCVFGLVVYLVGNIAGMIGECACQRPE